MGVYGYNLRLRNDLNKHFGCRFRLRFQRDVAECSFDRGTLSMITPIPLFLSFLEQRSPEGAYNYAVIRE